MKRKNYFQKLFLKTNDGYKKKLYTVLEWISVPIAKGKQGSCCGEYVIFKEFLRIS